MLNMNEAGVAVIAVAVATVAVAGGAVGTPVAVDEMDVQPDSPLYGLEKAGESIKESTIAGGQDWEIARGEERTQEYEYMASKAKEVTNNHVNLLDEAGDRFGKAVEASDSAEGLQKAKEALDKHISVLENVRENVPDVAKPAISMAISRSAKGKAVVEDVASGELPEKLGDAEKNEIKNQMKEINEHAEKVQEQVRENIDENSSEAEIAETVQNIELGTARDLENKANEMADEGKGESIPSIVEEAQARINAATNAAVDNDGLERARKASQKHLAVLENVYEKVPDVAKPAISLAMEQSSRHLGILENVKSQVPAIGEISQQVRETIRNKVQEMTENFKQANEKLQNQLEGVEEGSSEMDEIVEEYDNKAENQENGDEGEQYTPNIP